MAPNEYARNLETKQGLNIETAANSPVMSAALTHFVFSSLSDAERWSGGKYAWNFHFEGKADVPKHIKNKIPDLAAKMSTVQVGIYASNWKGGMERPQKQEDGSFVVQIPDVAEKKLPWFFVQPDTGVYVKALLENEPGKHVLAFSEMTTWREFWELWSSMRGVKVQVQVVSVESFSSPCQRFSGGISRSH
ncbi:NmrA-like family domain-containing protein 1 [Emericellopsis cladophorae]|uniref:NmrA-like family domain-containing protein 1 n=1 Tax=Emericellopsis cladophorae TaxID=2686198 RepID=A0A9P9XTG8_9HYPO|nr:NmrA-like family domain-containing protein 1 [Emericellopsis cladophorae]KAI6777612.1 NmrA-like family domain-containing protein 1 [Emericellopsis cladophorae]